MPEGISESEIQQMIPQSDEINYVSDLREWLISQECRPCARVGCLNPLPRDARKNKKYCSYQCKEAEKSRRWRTRHPKAKKKADKNYLNSLEEEDFVD